VRRFSWIVSVLFLVGLNAGIIWNALFNQPEPPKQLARNAAPVATPVAKPVSKPVVKPVSKPVVKPVVQASQKKISPSTPKAPQKDQLVYKTQVQLKKQGIYKSEADGLYGAETRIAIARYQRLAGLKVDGQPSDYLLNHMFISANSLGKKMAGQKPQTASHVGSTALVNPVKRVQIGLEELGYNPGPSDGLMGAQTREAIRQFEKDNKLEITGKVSDTLLKKLLKITGTSFLNNT